MNKKYTEKEIEALEYIDSHSKDGEIGIGYIPKKFSYELIKEMKDTGLLRQNDDRGNLQFIHISEHGRTFLMQHRINRNIEDGGKVNERMLIFTIILLAIGILQFVSSFLALNPTNSYSLIAYYLLFATGMGVFVFIGWMLHKVMKL